MGAASTTTSSDRTTECRRRVLCVGAGATLLWLCFCAPALTQPGGTPPTKGRTSEQAASMEAWRATMDRTPRPKEGCFKAEYPKTEWIEIPCVTAPNQPYPPAVGLGVGPEAVGNGVDFAAQTTGLITSATGSFEHIAGVTSESGYINNTPPLVANTYSLQLNTSFFNTAVCNGAAVPANCKGWQQFIYSSSYGVAFMQYWLINWGTTCLAGWTAYSTHCYRNSLAATATAPTITNISLAGLNLKGEAVASGMDRVTISTPSTIVSAPGNDNVLLLAQSWNLAEFNIFGDCCGSDAVFNLGARMAVRTSIDDTTTNAPTCVMQGYTGETNSLSLVPPCCAYGGATPAIVFWQSSNPGATSMCSGGSSIGDTHLTNFNGLLFDFQASGDFLLAQTDPGFMIQTRQKSGAPNWPSASVNKAVAMRINKSRLAVCIEPNRFVVDGKPTNLASGASLSLPGLTVTRNANVYVFQRASSESVRVEVNNGWINTSVNLGQVQVAKVRGLIGNANGNTGQNDLAASDRTVLAQPISFNDLYRRYGDSWRVPPADSLLMQYCGDKGVEQGNPQQAFYPQDLKPEDRKRATEICTKAGVKEGPLLEACIIDTVVIGAKAAAAFVRAAPPRAVLHPVRDR